MTKIIPMKRATYRWVGIMVAGVIAGVGTTLWGLWFLLGSAVIGTILIEIGLGHRPDE